MILLNATAMLLTLSLADITNNSQQSPAQSASPTVALAAWTQFVASAKPGEMTLVSRFVLNGAGQDCTRFTLSDPRAPGSVAAAARNNPDTSAFPVTVCEALLDTSWENIIITDNNGTPVQIRKTDLSPGPLTLAGPAFIGKQQSDEIRLLSFGDSGCRGTNMMEPCTPNQWPLNKIAKQMVQEDADLIVHVGDYRYWHEGFSPDNWANWDADFFRPAQPLLVDAPWLLSRGNHEQCSDQTGSIWYGQGYYFFFEAKATTNTQLCPPNNQRRLDDNWSLTLPAKTVFGGALIPSHTLLALDTSPTPYGSIAANLETNLEKAIQSSLGHSVWWITHRPLSSLAHYAGSWHQDDSQVRAAFNAALAQQGLSIADLCKNGAYDTKCSPSLFLSGHIHLYQEVNFDTTNSPIQVIVGNGGVETVGGLSTTPCSYDQMDGDFSSKATITTQPVHGYVVWSRTSQSVTTTKTGWLQKPVFINPPVAASPLAPCQP